MSRLSTNLQLVEQLLAHPMLGIGELAVWEIRAAGYMSHTFLLLLLAAYGIVGFLPLVVVAAFMAVGRRPACPPANAGILLLSTTMFVNDLWPWLGLAFALVAHGHFDLHRREDAEKDGP